MEIKLNNDVLFILKSLNDAGYQAYIVGGCMRDFLLEIQPNDYDITTNALTSQIKEVFKDEKIIETGIKYGTVTLLLNNKAYEITTFRANEQYLDWRHPDKLNFSNDLKEDLLRRDFSMNAIAYNPNTGIIDPFNGQKDIENRLIKTVGQPIERFQEDALRILRALRFAGKLNFNIDTSTSLAIHSQRNLIRNISIERITNEFTKLLLADYPKYVLAEYKDVFSIFINELDNISSYHYFDNCQLIEKAAIDLAIRLSIYLHNLTNASDILDRLKLPNKIKNEVKILIENYYNIIKLDRINIKKMLYKYDVDLTQKIFSMQFTTGMLNKKLYQQSLDIIDEIKNKKLAYKINQLAINGNTIKSLGYQRQEIGLVLNKILNLVIDEKLPNDEVEITTYLIKTKIS